MEYAMCRLKKRNFLYISLIVCIVLSGCASVPSGRKKESAADTAHIQKQHDVVLIFTGSDWSNQAEYFSKTVLNDSFRTEAEKNYAVQYIDLPRNPAESERENIQKNYLLFSEYAVSDVPFIVMQTPQQDIYAAAVIEAEIRTGEALLEKLTELSAQRTAVIEARALIERTQGAEKAKAIDSFLNTVYGAESRRYDSLRMQVPGLDPQNISGLKGKYLLITADIQAKTLAHKGDFAGAAAAYQAAAESGKLAAEELQLAWYLTAYAHLMADNTDTGTVIAYLQKAVQAAPESAGVPQIKQAIQKLQTKAQVD